jgi:DNA-binding FadR family transcriptional regulator
MQIGTAFIKRVVKLKLDTGSTNQKEGNHVEIKPIRSQTKQELFVQQVEDWIFSGQLKPGDSLPSERTLAEQMEVSRSVINRGLNQLAQLKLIRVNPQSGSTVNDYFKEGDLQTLNELLHYTRGHYDPALLRSMYQARQLVEGEIVRLVSTSITKAQAAQLRNIVDDFALSDQQSGEFLYRFFHQLAIDADNQVYPLLISSFHSVYVVLGGWNSTKKGREKIIQLNRRLVRALAGHRTAEAVKIHRELIRWSLNDLLR